MLLTHPSGRRAGFDEERMAAMAGGSDDDDDDEEDDDYEGGDSDDDDDDSDDSEDGDDDDEKPKKKSKSKGDGEGDGGEGEDGEKKKNTKKAKAVNGGEGEGEGEKKNEKKKKKEKSGDGEGDEGGKKKKEKKVKDKNAPVGAKSAYIIFSTEQRSAIKEANPDLSFGQLTSKIAEVWKGLSKEQKEPYELKAQDDKKRYQAENEVYLKNKGEDAPAAKESKTKDAAKEGDKPAKVRSVRVLGSLCSVGFFVLIAF
jgi:structure-specific recognition protein 1